MKTLKLLFLATIAFSLVFSSCSRKFMVIETPVKQPAARQISPPNVALVLGGGAFHGMAHVGVIKILEGEGIPIDLIVGTSAGSLVGALYASKPHIDSLEGLVGSTKARDVFDFSLLRSTEGFVSGKRLQAYVLKNTDITKIEETKIPFVAVTTDIEKGKTVALKAGPIAPSVNASCAIPGIFEPVKMYGTTFVDGGVLDCVPANIAKEYNPKVIIAVRIMDFDTVPEMKNRKQVYQRAYTVAAHNMSEYNSKDADIIISPDLEGLPLMSSKDNKKLYELGVAAAKASLPQIIALLKKEGIQLRK